MSIVRPAGCICPLLHGCRHLLPREDLVCGGVSDFRSVWLTNSTLERNLALDWRGPVCHSWPNRWAIHFGTVSPIVDNSWMSCFPCPVGEGFLSIPNGCLNFYWLEKWFSNMLNYYLSSIFGWEIRLDGGPAHSQCSLLTCFFVSNWRDSVEWQFIVVRISVPFSLSSRREE